MSGVGREMLRSAFVFGNDCLTVAEEPYLVLGADRVIFLRGVLFGVGFEMPCADPTFGRDRLTVAAEPGLVLEVGLVIFLLVPVFGEGRESPIADTILGVDRAISVYLDLVLGNDQVIFLLDLVLGAGLDTREICPAGFDCSYPL